MSMAKKVRVHVALHSFLSHLSLVTFGSRGSLENLVITLKQNRFWT